MVKFGIISDTHVSENDEKSKIQKLIIVLKETFKDVDQIIHGGIYIVRNFSIILEP